MTTAGRPVGMADTENATAVRNSSSNGVSRHSPMPIEMSQRDAGDDQDLVGQAVELPGERRDLVLGDLEHAADVADLGRHPGLGRRGCVPAPRVTWVFMNARSTRSPRAASAATASTCLGTGHALAGQRRFVDLERRRGQDPAVGRDEVAGLDVDDVARDELLHRDLDERAVAPDLGLDDHHLLERGDARRWPCLPGSGPSRR